MHGSASVQSATSWTLCVRDAASTRYIASGFSYHCSPTEHYDWLPQLQLQASSSQALFPSILPISKTMLRDQTMRPLTNMRRWVSFTKHLVIRIWSFAQWSKIADSAYKKESIPIRLRWRYHRSRDMPAVLPARPWWAAGGREYQRSAPGSKAFRFERCFVYPGEQ